MKSYTINLKRSFDRRKHVEIEIAKIPFVNNEYVEGVDGTLLSEEEKSEFKKDSAKNRYGRFLKLGEIGCTLSHRRCYELILKNKEDAAIIFEDDIIIKKEDGEIWDLLYHYIEKEKEPTVILLSGGYWYKRSNKKFPNILKNVFSAYYTHCYIINKSAATLILSLNADYLADDWRMFSNNGLNIFAAYPHLVDQQWDGSVPSMIQNEAKSWFQALPFKYKLKSYLKMFPCKILELLGRHEPDSYDGLSQI